MKEQKYKLGKRRIDKLRKQFGLSIKLHHSGKNRYMLSYSGKTQTFMVDIEFSRRNILCWTSTGTIETITHNQFYKVYQIIAEVQKYENS